MADESWRVPSIVQELAATVHEPPSRYLIPEQDRRDDQLAGAEMPDPVPTIVSISNACWRPTLPTRRLPSCARHC